MKLLGRLAVVTLLSIPNFTFAQAPPLGTAANFVLFSTTGAMGNTGISQLTGNVGTNNGSINGFGNVNGQMHNADGASAQASADLLIAYNQLNNTVANFFPAPLLGNGQVLNAGVYSISAASTLNLNLILDAQGNSNAVFIFKIAGPLCTNTNSKVKLINGALACNVFWKVEGVVSMASGTSMKGTVIANNAAIVMNANDTLEGRALSTAGAVTIDGTIAYTPVGCGSPTLTGPAAPNLLSTACYTLFSSNGALANSGTTNVSGDVGTNVGLTTGFNPLFVNGAIHPIPDGSTAATATDLVTVFNYLNTLPYDIELLYPAQFGHNLVLTPHTYLLNAATTFTDTLYLNAMGDANAVFVIQINGALSTSTFAKVILTNGTQAKNVFWKVDGAVSINDYSVINGTIIANNGAVSLNTGVELNGRALTTTGSFTTTAITAIAPAGCNTVTSPIILSQPEDQIACTGTNANFSVIASGTGLTYQWRNGTVNLIDGAQIAGANTATLSINNIVANNASTNYNVIVTGAPSTTITSNNASLIVNTTPQVPGNISGPTNICGNNSPSYAILSVNGATSYTWNVPAGITITSGIGTTSITTLVNGAFAIGNITVTAGNDCGTSLPQSITVTNCVASTQLSTAYCGRTDFSLTGIILANPVSGATQYEFEFSLNGNVYATKLQSSNQLSIASVTPNFNWGTTYQVRVRSYLGTTVGNYGPVCDIGFIADPNILGIPTTQLVSANCGRLNFPLNGAIGANPVASATRYEFEFSQGGIVYATRLSLNRFAGFNVISPALQAGQQYDVRVRAHIGNVVGTYGASCVIALVSGARFNPAYIATAADYELQAGEEFPIQLDANGNAAPEISVMPNPFSGNATLFVGNLDAAYSVNVFNIEGKLVETLNNQNQTNITIGNNLVNGIYFVELSTENGFIQRTKIVKAD